MMQVVEYTNSHHDERMSKQLRKSPVLFVKAKEVYDPNSILHELARKNKTLLEGVESINLEHDEESSQENDDYFDEDAVEFEDDEDIVEDDHNDENYLEASMQKWQNNMRHESPEPIRSSGHQETPEELGEQLQPHSDNIAGRSFQSLPSGHAPEEVDSPTEENDSSLEEFNEVESDSPMEQELEEPAQEPEKANKAEPEEPPVQTQSLDIIIDTPTSTTIIKPEPVQNTEESTPEPEQEPEYGFLPEDYEFDVSRIEVQNVRFGIHNQYYVKCLELTGSDFAWIDEEEVIEFALAHGVKEHRLDKFLSFVTNGMIDQEEEESEPEVYISDDSESEDEDEEEEQEVDQEDDLESLIQYSKSSSQGFLAFGDRDFSNNTPAKYRSTFENLDIDDDLQESLHRQLANYKQNKKHKLNQKQKQLQEEAIMNNDLLIKYPDALRIKDIRYEFESLLKDENRTSVSFPKLDSHGHQTIKKLAKYYNMGVTNCGQSTNKYLKISKNKTTYKYYPNYDQIDRILRGRPIFHRQDVKRTPKTDKAEKAKKVTRGADSKARVREGDIVGAEAPEIDQSNVGRQMLEKLGWVKGQGLGAHGNQGINEPIVAKVKMSKTGIKETL
ncbi:uncharacterized protein SPAPADRAFT_54491 [Spathaspora passalidarum NRRL Y-27907]|uniref:G-patch domain-containing protein n=1 Tax=Spathaspora passalidarum (strain NRRL Y-27907 / 11-Y1) TaxID=619300 RepID=G3AI26_SPAPN|nr:uncharacterized protein SPAPADRAFT_54491 [Spathaspora passalidarum NRRL Y-27907]EGW34340.1 hypothetical protein SPAPADRAFT_54491 [Spathaspora passalidarum NRRL Y-27907]